MRSLPLLTSSMSVTDGSGQFNALSGLIQENSGACRTGDANPWVVASFCHAVAVAGKSPLVCQLFSGYELFDGSPDNSRFAVQTVSDD